jgi:hypothetical protein
MSKRLRGALQYFGGHACIAADDAEDSAHRYDRFLGACELSYAMHSNLRIGFLHMFFSARLRRNKRRKGNSARELWIAILTGGRLEFT